MILSQTKTLKEILAGANIPMIRKCGSKVHVRAQKKYIGNRQYEYGSAVAHTDALTDEQIAALKTLGGEYINIHNDTICDFAIIKR